MLSNFKKAIWSREVKVYLRVEKLTAHRTPKMWKPQSKL